MTSDSAPHASEASLYVLKAQEALAQAAIDAIRKASSKTGECPVNVFIVLMYWMQRATYHLEALLKTARSPNATAVTVVHLRQILELVLQGRYILHPKDMGVRETLARKVIIWALSDFIQMADHDEQDSSAIEALALARQQLSSFDEAEINNVNKEFEIKNYWFGKNYRGIARETQRDAENLEVLYQHLSAQAHGSWDIPFIFTRPQPDRLSYQPFPDYDVYAETAAGFLEQGRHFCVSLWGDIARECGMPEVELDIDGILAEAGLRRD